MRVKQEGSDLDIHPVALVDLPEFRAECGQEELAKETDGWKQEEVGAEVEEELIVEDVVHLYRLDTREDIVMTVALDGAPRVAEVEEFQAQDTAAVLRLSVQVFTNSP